MAPAIRADRSRIARVVAIAAAVVVLDQITKLIVLNRLALGVPVVLIEGFLALTLVMNPGLAFGLLAGIPAGWRWVVGLLSLVALVVLLRVALRILPSGGWREQSAIGLDLRRRGRELDRPHALRRGRRLRRRLRSRLALAGLQRGRLGDHGRASRPWRSS